MQKATSTGRSAGQSREAVSAELRDASEDLDPMKKAIKRGWSHEEV